MTLVNVLSVIKMILLIGLLIFVHEFGHFIVAKMFKMKVERFCFGLPFGPVLYEKKIGDVIYGIHWLFFLGGYVSFPDDNKENNLPKDSQDLFVNRPIYQRACVLLAGVTANFITAYLIVIFCCMHWGKLPSNTYDVYVAGFNSAPAATLNSGIKGGDKLYSINGNQVLYYNELPIVSQRSKKFDGKITEAHYNKVLSEFLKLNPDISADGVIEKDKTVKLPDTIEEDKIVLTLADIFGLKSKVKYITLNEEQEKIRNLAENKKNFKSDSDIPVSEFVTSIADTYSPIEIVVDRNGALVPIKTLYSGEKGLIGVSLDSNEKYIDINNFKDAIIATQKYMWTNTKLIFWSLKLLVSGRVPMESVTSIVAVTKVGADIIAKTGMMRALLLTAVISLNLAIINLFPIPALDGGHLLFLIIEKFKGKPVDEKVIEICSNIFFYILIALMLFFVFNDILSIWIRKIY